MVAIELSLPYISGSLEPCSDILLPIISDQGSRNVKGNSSEQMEIYFFDDLK